jgi:hypothetical protein
MLPYNIILTNNFIFDANMLTDFSERWREALTLRHVLADDYDSSSD